MLRKKLVLLNTGVIALTVAALMAGMIYITNRLAYDEARSSYTQMMRYSGDVLDDIFYSAREYTLDICIDDAIQDSLQAFHDGETHRIAGDGSLLNRMVGRYGIRSGILTTGIYPIGKDGIPYSFDSSAGSFRPQPSLNEEDWFSRPFSVPGGFAWTFVSSEGISVLRVSRPVYDTRDWKTPIAVVTAGIPASSLIPTLRSVRLGETSGAYLADGLGNILLPYSAELQLSAELLPSPQQLSYRMDNKDLLFVRRFTSNDWCLVRLVRNTEILRRSSATQALILALGIGLIFFAFFMSLMISHSISAPIIRLADSMAPVCQGDLTVELEPPRQRGEIQTLYESFNHMIEMLRRHVEERYVAKLRENETELKALQAQINPHFLYNTLDTIKWMAVKYGASDIQLMAVSLARMLRHSLNKGGKLIAVRYELEQVRSYVQIMERRYPAAFSAEYRIDEEILDCIIIKLVLQPLVENAILHGLNTLAREGRLLITGRLEKEAILFTVENNGSRIDLEKVRRILAGREDAAGRGYGIRNVNERLTRTYGAASGLDYRVNNGVTAVSFSIPAISAGDRKLEGEPT